MYSLLLTRKRIDKALTCVFSLLVVGLFMRGDVIAQTSPYVIPFQGRVTNQQGTPYVGGRYTIVFNLYDQAVGGSTLWTERHEKVGVSNGTVNVFLGSIAPLPTVVPATNPPVSFFSTVKYLGITIDADDNAVTADPEMVPRQQIIPAFHAKNADSMKGYDWSVVFGSTVNLNSATIPSGKIPQLSLSHLPDNIPASKLAAGAAVQNLNASGFGAVASGGIVFGTSSSASSLASAGFSQMGRAVVGGYTERLPTPLLSPRVHPFVAWTGTRLLVWGGAANSPHNPHSDGAVYDVSSRTWSVMGLAGSRPSSRSTATGPNSSGLWTGSKMIVWGGYSGSASLGDGAVFDPDTGSWAAIPAGGGSPSHRFAFAQAWTGTEFLVWGGVQLNPTAVLNDGARYNLGTGAWTAMEPAPVGMSARNSMAFAWTGTELFIWGGTGMSASVFGNGALYNPQTNSWRTIATANAPTAREGTVCVWTGSRVFVWGGRDGTSAPGGKLFNPAGPNGSWEDIPPAPIRSDRVNLHGVWTGEAVLISGGMTIDGLTTLSDSAAYYPSTNTWVVCPDVGPMRARYAAHWVPQLEGVVFVCGTESETTGGAGVNAATMIRPAREVFLYQKQ